MFDLEKLDATIETIEERIIKNEFIPESSAAGISALASLIQAGALISKQEEE